MKTTLEIPDALFRKVKSRAAEQGQTLKEYVGEALKEKLASSRRTAASAEPEWMSGFGKLRRLREDTRAVERRISEAFEAIEPEDEA